MYNIRPNISKYFFLIWLLILLLIKLTGIHIKAGIVTIDFIRRGLADVNCVSITLSAGPIAAVAIIVNTDVAKIAVFSKVFISLCC